MEDGMTAPKPPRPVSTTRSNGTKSGAIKRNALRWKFADRKLAEQRT